MFNFIKDFTLKIIEKLNINININKFNNSTTQNYNFYGNRNNNIKKYHSFNKKTLISLILFINIIYILVFCYSFYLIKNPFIKVSFLKIFPSPLPKVPIEIFYLIGYIFLYQCLKVFNKEILTRYFSKLSLIKFIMKYIFALLVCLIIFNNFFVVILYGILKLLSIIASVLPVLIENLLL